MRLKKGDKVRIISGKDRGREGKIEKIYEKQAKVLISQINLYKKHVKKSEEFPEGGVVDVSRPLAVSKVMFICPQCKKPTRVGYQIVKGKKVRICKHCQSVI